VKIKDVNEILPRIRYLKDIHIHIFYTKANPNYGFFNRLSLDQIYFSLIYNRNIVITFSIFLRIEIGVHPSMFVYFRRWYKFVYFYTAIKFSLITVL